MALRIAVMGASGNAGRELLQVLSERGVRGDAVIPLATGRAVGGQVSFGEDDVLDLGDLDRFDFAGVDLAYCVLPERDAKPACTRAAAAGVAVVDLSGAFRHDPAVPMVAADVNPQALDKLAGRIVATPQVTTLMLAQALAPIHDAFSVLRCVATVVLSVSTYGRGAMDELFNQTRGIFVNEPITSNQSEFAKQIAFNVIPAVGGFEKGGATGEEQATAQEVFKMFGADLACTVNAAMVPVFVGQGAFVNIECEDGFNEDQLRAAWRKDEGISVVDHRDERGVVTPAETHGEDSLYISRVRADTSADNAASFWLCGDNLRRQAINAARVGELLAARFSQPGTA